MNDSILIPILTYLSILAVIYYVYIHIILAGNDPKATTKNFVSNIFYIIIPVISIFILLSLILFDASTVTYFIIGAFIVTTIVYIIYYFAQFTISKYIFNKYLLYIVVFAIFLFGASIIYTIFSGTFRKMTGWTGFFMNLLFYIPCLLRDLVASLVKEYSTFSNTLLVLFAIEVLLIMLYFFMIPFVNSNLFPTQTVILEDPIMLNKGVPLKTPVDISNNFGISMWVYVNPGSTKEETSIFSLLDASGNTHIKLSYSNIEQGNNDFVMYVGEESFPISLPLQKWHNFVFNYVTYDTELPSTTGTPTPTTSPPPESMWKYLLSYFYKTPASTPKPRMISQTTVDMFINGVLKRSFTYDGINKSIPIIKNNSQIYTGELEERDGLYGAICNIVYYNSPVTKMALVYNYNTLSIQNPPV
jgi:hypothetical protein